MRVLRQNQRVIRSAGNLPELEKCQRIMGDAADAGVSFLHCL